MGAMKHDERKLHHAVQILPTVLNYSVRLSDTCEKASKQSPHRGCTCDLLEHADDMLDSCYTELTFIKAVPAVKIPIKGEQVCFCVQVQQLVMK